MNETSYISTIHSSCSRYPDLVKLSKYLKELTKNGELPGRAAVLEFRAGRVEGHEFEDVYHLNKYLHGTVRSPCKRRLYILEDLSVPYIEAFGSHFRMDPCLFATQENSTHWTGIEHSYTVSRRLPSMLKSDLFYTLRYYEAVKLTEKSRAGTFRTVSNVERKIESGDPSNHDLNGASESRHFVVRKNASFWSRVGKDEGWDSLILVDPPIDDSIYISGLQGPRNWPNKPYGRGYIDFTPWEANIASLAQDQYTVPRTSIFDDIIWYWTSAASKEEVLAAESDAATGAWFLKKIVASMWNVFLEYIWARVSEFERSLGAFEGGRSGQQRLNELSGTLDRVNFYRGRLAYYVEEFEWSLQNLGITIDDLGNHDGKDFFPILRRLRGCKGKMESLLSVVTGYLSVRQGEISLEQTKVTIDQTKVSIDESHLLSKLTYLALIFVPLSYVASIFSMGGDFLPGASHFWVYFATALPATTIIFVFAWLLRARRLPEPEPRTFQPPVPRFQ